MSDLICPYDQKPCLSDGECAKDKKYSRYRASWFQCPRFR